MTIFSTQQTLSSPLVAQWVQTEAIDTLALWLASGHPHPRLATEAIAHAVGQGKVAIANMVWQAGWHKPTLVFEDSWRQLRQHHYGATKEGRDFQATHGAALDWLLDKSTGATDKKLAGHQNLSLIHGLRLAFDMPTPDLWDRILDLGVDCNAAAAHDFLQHAKNYVSWWPNPFAHAPVRVAQWAQDRAVPDLLDHGLKPGGSVWVGAMEKEDAGPLFENLLNRADTLTSPRQRLTILLYAQHQGVLQERWDHLLPVFMDLGVPAEVRLSPSELKRATTAEQRLAIAAGDSAHDARSWLKQYYHRQPLFEQESIAFQEPLRSDIYNHYRHQKLEDTLPTAAPKKATPRF